MISKKVLIVIAILAALAAVYVFVPAGIAGIAVRRVNDTHTGTLEQSAYTPENEQTITMTVSAFLSILQEQNRHDEAMMQNIKDVATTGIVSQATVSAMHDLTNLIVYLVIGIGALLVIGLLIVGKEREGKS